MAQMPVAIVAVLCADLIALVGKEVDSHALVAGERVVRQYLAECVFPVPPILNLDDVSGGDDISKACWRLYLDTATQRQRQIITHVTLTSGVTRAAELVPSASRWWR